MLKGKKHRDLIDMTGQRFGRLRVIEYGRGEHFGKWRCRCDCGSECLVYGSPLRRGVTKSCGCFQREKSREKATHGNSRRECVSPEYKVWSGMIRRCENQKEVSYERYGGRGITVCQEWRKSFAAFLRDMGQRPSAKHSIDRWPDTNGNYEPGNCRWATSRQQARNKRNSRRLVVFDQTMTLADACEKFGLRVGTVWVRLERGWTIEEALTTPVNRKYHSQTQVNQPTEEEEHDEIGA